MSLIIGAPGYRRRIAQRILFEGYSDLYWRLYITANNGGGITTVAEIAFYDMQENLIDTFTNRATNSFANAFANSSNRPQEAFDLNDGTKWTDKAVGSFNICWVGYFFASPMAIKKFDLMGQFATGTQANLAPKDFRIQAAPDIAGPWTDVGDPVTGQTGWGGAEVRTFTIQ